MNKWLYLLFVSTALFGEITTYSKEEQTALNHYLTLWENPDFQIDQHKHFVNKTIDRVILAVNENPAYLSYWPRVAKAWSRFIGIKPTLIYIGRGEVPFSGEFGEIVHIPPVEGVPTAFQAQCVRLLAPTLFPDEICVIADLDQFPLNAEFFHRPFEVLGEDAFIMYELLPNKNKRRKNVEFRMSYNAAKGKIFGEIFNVHNRQEIQQTLKNWNRQYRKKYGFHTDQTLLAKYLKNWSQFETKCFHLGREYLSNSLAKTKLTRKHLLNKTKNTYKFDSELIEDCWRGRYVEFYLEKGHIPFNQFVYKTFKLEPDA